MNVMYFSYQPYFIEMADIMNQENNWNPVYWVVVNETRGIVKDKYPDVICHDHYDGTKGVAPDEYKNLDLLPLSPTLIQEMREHESIVLDMFERNDAHTNTFSYQERVKLYRYFLQYWITVLEDLKPECVVFEEEPHQANDYVLYSLCQKLGIKTIMFVQSIFYPHMCPVLKFEEGSKLILKQYQEELKKSSSAPKLSEYMEKYFTDIKGSYDKAVALHLFHQVDEVNDLLAGTRSILAPIKKAFQGIKEKINITDMKTRWDLLTKPECFYSDQKQRNKTFRESKLTYLENIYYKFKTVRKKSKLKKYYDSIAHSVDINEDPYVFLALNYQPEKTTSPLGGIFGAIVISGV